MHVFRDSEAIRTAPQKLPELAQRLTWLTEEVSNVADCELGDLMNILVAEEGDKAKDVIRALGFDFWEEPVESITTFLGWNELTFIVNGEGFGYILYVPDRNEIDSELLGFCRSQLPEGG